MERTRFKEQLDAQQSIIDELWARVEDAEAQPSQAKVVVQEKEVIKVVPNEKREREVLEELAKSKEALEVSEARNVALEIKYEKLDNKNNDLIDDLNRIRRERDNNATAAKRQASRANDQARDQKETLKKLTRSKEEALTATRERVQFEDEVTLLRDQLNEAVNKATSANTELTRVRTHRSAEHAQAENVRLEGERLLAAQVDNNERTKSKLNRNIGNQRTTMDKQAAEIAKQVAEIAQQATENKLSHQKITSQTNEINTLKTAIKTKQTEIEKSNSVLKSNIIEQVSPQIVIKIQERDRKIQDLESQLANKEAVLQGYKVIPKELKVAQEEARKERAKNAQLLKQKSQAVAEIERLKTLPNVSTDSGNSMGGLDESSEKIERENQIEVLKLELTQAKAMLGSAQAAVDSEIEKGEENLKEFKRVSAENMKQIVEEEVAAATLVKNNDLIIQNQNLQTNLTEKMKEVAATSKKNDEVSRKNKVLKDNLNQKLKEIEEKGTVKNLAKHKADASRLAAENRGLKKKAQEEVVTRLALEFRVLEKDADEEKIQKLTKCNRELGEKNQQLAEHNEALTTQVSEFTNPPLFSKIGALEIKNATNRQRKPNLRNRQENPVAGLKKPIGQNTSAKQKAAQTSKKRGKAGKTGNPLLDPKPEEPGLKVAEMNGANLAVNPVPAPGSDDTEDKNGDRIAGKLTKMAIRGEDQNVDPVTDKPGANAEVADEEVMRNPTKEQPSDGQSEGLSLGSDFGNNSAVLNAVEGPVVKSVEAEPEEKETK